MKVNSKKEKRSKKEKSNNSNNIVYKSQHYSGIIRKTIITMEQ